MAKIVTPSITALSVESVSSIDTLDGVAAVRRPVSAPALRLTTPNWVRTDPTWVLIEASIRACIGETDDGQGVYCVLAEVSRNNYVQTAYAPEAGFNAWRLEWRITHDDDGYEHYFAVTSNDDSGVVRHIDYVLNAFKAFYRGEVFPDGLQWVRYDI
jgi:hypothetical protein